jgi:hypothetical protein
MRSQALIGVSFLSLLLIPLAAATADVDATAAGKLARIEAGIPSLGQQLASSSSLSSAEIVPRGDAVNLIGGERCTTRTTCQNIVCILDGTEGVLGVTKRTCCPICQSPPCEIQSCTTEILSVFCGCG